MNSIIRVGWRRSSANCARLPVATFAAIPFDRSVFELGQDYSLGRETL